MAIDGNTVVVRDNEAMFSTMDDEVVILNLKGNNYLGLDSVGTRIWELLHSPVCVDTLCKQLNQEFEGTPEQIQSGVLSFLTELEIEGMVHGIGE